MAYFFADGFNFYASTNDMLAGYWDSGTLTGLTFGPGRFAGSQCVRNGTSISAWLIKASGVNDAVHHFNFTFQDTSIVAGNTTPAFYIQLLDGVTNQCCVVFRYDGSMVLTSGAPGGTVLATYASAISAQSVWFSYEVEVVIHPSAGSFTVRTNGAASNSFQATGLNTRTSANSYANKISLGMANSVAANVYLFGDLVWRSDASSVAWIGDVRALQQMPVSDVSTQFSRAPSSTTITGTPFNTTTDATGTARYTPFTPTNTGTVGSILVNVNTAFTGNMKCSIFSDIAGNPGAVLGSATPIVNPVSGNNTMTFGTPVAVSKNVQYWWGVSHDVTAVLMYVNTTTGRTTSGVTYAAFPTASPAAVGSTAPVAGTVNITLNVNSDAVNEAQQDGTVSYTYDSVVGHADLYDLADLPGPATIYAVTTRGFMCKSDAGSRSGQLQIRSGSVGTTWNPSDKVSTIVLSNGNLTASGGVSSVGNVRSTGTVATGLKFYFEQTYVTPTTGIIGVGIANSSAVVNTNNYANTAFITDGGNIFINGSNTGINLGTFTTGIVIGIAVDLANYLIWFREGPAGNWNGNASYSPGGTGGQSISAFMTGVPAYGYLAYNSSGAVVTANFGGSAFAGAVPSGFTAGFFIGTTVQSTALVLSSSFLWNYRTDTTNPNGGAAWTASAVNALQVGPVVQA